MLLLAFSFQRGKSYSLFVFGFGVVLFCFVLFWVKMFTEIWGLFPNQDDDKDISFLGVLTSDLCKFEGK